MYLFIEIDQFVVLWGVKSRRALSIHLAVFFDKILVYEAKKGNENSLG